LILKKHPGSRITRSRAAPLKPSIRMAPMIDERNGDLILP
jgi:hypothetical protein